MVGLSPREYTIEEYTKTVCPQCLAEKPRTSADETFVDGMLVAHDGAIWMRRFCKIHGETESLYEEDAELWRGRAGWQTPTLRIQPDRPDNFRAFPAGYRDGLPASHAQHTCILLLNVTEHCNYQCPTCYASALPVAGLANPGPTIEEIEHTVRTVIARENGKLGVLMLSGGEPTIRKDLPDLIERLSALPITRILINTNGRRFLRDDSFRERLARLKDRIEVYLQFDSLQDGPYQHFRGEALADEKRLTLQALSDAGIFTTLVSTVEEGINDQELGDLLRLGLATPFVSGWAIQPVFGSGRGVGIDPRRRITPTGVLKRLAAQAPEVVELGDFIPLPCSHRDCCDIAYFLRDAKNDWRSITRLIGRVQLKEWIHLVSNTISFEDSKAMLRGMVQAGVLQRVFSEQQKTSSLQLAKDLFTMCDCLPGLGELVSSIWKKEPAESAMAQRTFRCTVKMFMDAHTFHEARIRQCCVHVGTFEDDPRRYSFCWRWMFEDATDRP